jgi:hypothetical protein
MLSFATSDLPDVVYIEQLTSAMYLDKQMDVEHYGAAMDKVSSTSLTPQRSKEFISQLLEGQEGSE